MQSENGERRREREKKRERGGKAEGGCWRDAYFQSRVIPRYHEQQIKRSFSKNSDKEISLGIYISMEAQVAALRYENCANIAP